MRYYILDENGNPKPVPDVITWAMWFESNDREVAYTEKEDGVFISTVFLGIDHSFGGDKPLLFETMIFGGDNDGYQDRYATKEEALAGHEEALLVATGLKP